MSAFMACTEQLYLCLFTTSNGDASNIFSNAWRPGTPRTYAFWESRYLDEFRGSFKMWRQNIPTWSERGAVDRSVITAVSDWTRRRRQSVSLGLAVGESVQVLARLGGAWYAYRWLLPPNSLSLDHASAPPGAYLQSDGNFCWLR